MYNITPRPVLKQCVVPVINWYFNLSFSNRIVNCKLAVREHERLGGVDFFIQGPVLGPPSPQTEQRNTVLVSVQSYD